MIKLTINLMKINKNLKGWNFRQQMMIGPTAPLPDRLDESHHCPPIKMTSKKYYFSECPVITASARMHCHGGSLIMMRTQKRIFTHPLILLSHLLVLSSFFVILLCDGCHGWNDVNDDDLLFLCESGLACFVVRVGGAKPGLITLLNISAFYVVRYIFFPYCKSRY